MKTKIKLLIAGLFGFILAGQANNVTLTNPSVAGQNITFKISWDNSWNTTYEPNNHDAVWVFVKYQDCNTQLWAHASLSAIVGDHSAAAPLQVVTVADGKGVFLKRSAVGGGNIASTNITLKMTIPPGTYNYKVYGIEMVNVPTGTYSVGNTGSEVSKYNVTTIDAAAQSSGLSAAALGGGSLGLSSSFPMGYNGFYCMKYEISQQQYVDFLNSLTYNQQASRIDVAPNSPVNTYILTSNSNGGNRNYMMIQTPGNNSALPAVFACGQSTPTGYSSGDDGENIACNKLSFVDVMAYLDWAALRPMTEMEYEKTCRGPVAPVANELAWGTTDKTNWVPGATGGLTNAYMPNEYFALTPVSGVCNCGVATSAAQYGPGKVGIFATNSSGRASSGAAYYGAMEMTGNVGETTITTANAAGVAFNGTLGDGELDATGNPNANTWPTGTTGLCIKGASWVHAATATHYSVSDRYYRGENPQTRIYWCGGRGVR